MQLLSAVLCSGDRNCTLRWPEEHRMHTLRMHFHGILSGRIRYVCIFMVHHPLKLARDRLYTEKISMAPEACGTPGRKVEVHTHTTRILTKMEYNTILL